MVEWLVSEPMLIYYIHNFRDSMWPGGSLAEPAPPRTAEVTVLESCAHIKRFDLLVFLPLFLWFTDGLFCVLRKNSKLRKKQRNYC